MELKWPDSIPNLMSFRALKLSRFEKFRGLKIPNLIFVKGQPSFSAIKFSKYENFRAVILSILENLGSVSNFRVEFFSKYKWRILLKF